MLLVPWHSFTIWVQTRMWNWVLLTSLKYHSLYPYAYIQTKYTYIYIYIYLHIYIYISKDRGWQKLGIFIRRRIHLYLSCLHILPWGIFFCQGSAIRFKAELWPRHPPIPYVPLPVTTHPSGIQTILLLLLHAATFISSYHLNEAKGFSKSKGFTSFIKEII